MEIEFLHDYREQKEQKLYFCSILLDENRNWPELGCKKELKFKTFGVKKVKYETQQELEDAENGGQMSCTYTYRQYMLSALPTMKSQPDEYYILYRRVAQ